MSETSPRSEHVVLAVFAAAACAIIALFAAIVAFDIRSKTPHPKSLAVLPFQDASAAGDQDWFAEGLAEELITALSRCEDLRVTGRTVSFAAVSPDQSLRALGARLRVAYILQGKVRRDDRALQVRVELIHARDGAVAWAQTYDRPRDAVFAIQEDLATRVARTLDTVMDPKALASMADLGTRDPEAYDAWLAYLDAHRAAFAGGDIVDGLARAYVHAERARALDPGFARAHYAAAEYWLETLDYGTMVALSTTLSESERQDRFKTRIRAAISAAEPPQRAQYEAALAFQELRLADAAAAAERFLTEAPNAASMMSAVYYLAYAGQFDAASRWLRRARRAAPDDAYVLQSVATFAYYARDFELAADAARHLARETPYDAHGLYQAHRALLWAGRVSAAKALAPRIARSDLPPIYKEFAALRQLCADRRHAKAARLAATLADDRTTSALDRVLIDLVMGRPGDAQRRIAAIEAQGRRHEAASFLGFPQVDLRWSAVLTEAFRSQGLAIPEPIAPPFACDAETAAVTTP